MSEGLWTAVAIVGYVLVAMLAARIALHFDPRMTGEDAAAVAALFPLVIVFGGTYLAGRTLWRLVDYPFTRVEQYRQRRIAAEREVDRWLGGR